MYKLLLHPSPFIILSVTRHCWQNASPAETRPSHSRIRQIHINAAPRRFVKKQGCLISLPVTSGEGQVKTRSIPRLPLRAARDSVRFPGLIGYSVKVLGSSLLLLGAQCSLDSWKPNCLQSLGPFHYCLNRLGSDLQDLFSIFFPCHPRKDQSKRGASLPLFAMSNPLLKCDSVQWLWWGRLTCSCYQVPFGGVGAGEDYRSRAERWVFPETLDGTAALSWRPWERLGWLSLLPTTNQKIHLGRKRDSYCDSLHGQRLAACAPADLLSRTSLHFQS